MKSISRLKTFGDSGGPHLVHCLHLFQYHRDRLRIHLRSAHDRLGFGGSTIDLDLQFQYFGIMEMYDATEAFASLAQETRLKVFKLLLEYGADGLVPGTIAGELKIPDNTLSFHLSHMSRAGLVTSKKQGRSITYFANVSLIEDLIGYLQENCCVRQSKSKTLKSKNERKC